MRSFPATNSLRASHPTSGACRMGGFTLIEVMVVLAIVVILIAIAGPDFRKMIIATRVKNASFDVFSSLTHARSEAVTRNTTVRICGGTNWASGWTVTFAPDCDPGNITSTNTIKTQGAYQGITITNPDTSVSFNGMGRVTAAASFSIEAPSASDENKRCVTLDPSGRPITKPPVKTGFTCP